MGKDAASRRAWVKNVAIIFLVILLLLTFFSKTILNYSLPEVSAQYAKYASISNALKLSGTVKANENYSVIYEEQASTATEGVTQSRKVVSVYVKSGDTVNIGDPIIALQGGASEELKKAESELADKEREYELALLGDKSSHLKDGKTLSDAERAITNAKEELAKLNELYSKASSGTDTTSVIKAQIKAVEKVIKDLNSNKSDVEAKISELNSKIQAGKDNIETDFSGVSLIERLKLAEEEYSIIEASYNELTNKVATTKAELEKIQSSSGDIGKANEISNTIKSLNKTLDDLLLQKQRLIEDTNIPSNGNIDSLKRAYDEAKQKYNEFIDSNYIVLDSEASRKQIYEEALSKYNEAEQSGEGDLKSLEEAVAKAYDSYKTAADARTKLEEHKKAMDEAEKKYNDAANNDVDLKSFYRQIQDLEDKIYDTQSQINDAYEKLDVLGLPYIDDVIDYTVTYDLEVAQKAYDSAKASLDEVTEKYNTSKTKLESLKKQNQSSESVAENETILAVYKTNLEGIEDQLDAENEKLEDLKENLSDAESGSSQKPEDILDQIKTKKAEIEAAEEALEITKADGTVSNTTNKFEREKQKKEIDELKKKIEEYKNAPKNTQITAPIAGRIVSIDYVPGNTVTSGATVAQIEVSDKGYICEISVASDEARKVQVGAACSVTNSWWYSNLTASVTQIRSDPQSQGKNRIIVIEVKGDVYDGQSLQFSIGDKSQSYDSVLPNSAIREDSDGKFVLTVESKSTPLGVRYKAVRYNVEILASDDTQSAVSGLFGNEFVIINATSPVSDGQQVRLAEN